MVNLHRQQQDKTQPVKGGIPLVIKGAVTVANKIFGCIRETSENRALAGACIKAWDKDIGDDDFLGETISDTEGYYAISYPDSLWDTIPGAGSLTRPDIYVTVSIRNAAGEWVIIAKSPVYKDHKLSEDLSINLDCTVEKPVAKHTHFEPALHGFHFANNFNLTVDIMNLKLGSWNMGFCGGMCACALNRYKKNISIPADTEPPVQGLPLYKELLTRQITSMVTILAKIYDWQSAPDITKWYRKHSVGFRTKKQWSLLKEELDKGRPVILILIRSAGYFANPTDNHQVIATGYEYHSTTGDLKIYTYDPNWPDTGTHLSFCFGLADDQIRAQDSTGADLRGFFVNPNTDLASE